MIHKRSGNDSFPSTVISPSRNGRFSRTARNAMMLIRFFGAALILSAALSGCGEQPFGIFASLEREQAVPDSALSEAGITLGFTRAGNRYYLSLGRLFDASTGSMSWSTTRHPSRYSTDGDHAISLASDGTTLYAIFRNHDASSKDLYKRSGSSWNRIGLSGVSVRREIERVFYLNGKLFLTDGSKLYDVDDGAGTATAVGGISGRVVDIAYSDEGGTPYFWFVVTDGEGKREIHRTAADLTGATEASPSGSWFGGVHFIPAAESPTGDARVYVSTEGDAYYTEDYGGNWQKVSGDGDIRYTGIAHYVKGGDTVIVIGSERETTGSHPGGYFIIEGSNIKRPKDDDAERYEGSLLSRAHIQDFYADSAENRLFAMTYGRGVWRLEYEGNNEWRWE
jgi:hypothetical protein